MEVTDRMLHFHAAGRSDVGAAARKAGRGDEDSQCFRRLATDQTRGVEKWLCAVADGVGQRKGGSVASAQALNMVEDAAERFARWGADYLTQIDDALRSTKDYLNYVALCVDAQLRQNAENNVSITGMATTLTAVYLDGPQAYVLHAGDSRAYRYSGQTGALTQLTRDDSAPPGDDFDPEPRVALGALAPDQSVQISEHAIDEGDVLLLCTDGLWRELDDAMIVRVLRGSMDPQLAVDRLIRIANQRGGRGNMAVIVVHAGAAATVDDPQLDRDFPLAGQSAESGTPAPMPMPRREPAQQPASPPQDSSVAAEPLSPGGVEASPKAPTPERDAEALVTDQTPIPTDAAAIPAIPDRGAYAPRPGYSPHEPPERAPAGGFAAGLAVGVAATLVVLLAVVGVRWALAKHRPASQTAERTADAELAADVGESSSETVWLWTKPLDRKQGASAGTVFYRKAFGLDAQGDEDADYQPLSPDQAQEVTMYRRDDGLYLYLRIKFGIDPVTQKAQGDIVTLKFKPEDKAVGEVRVKRGAGVPQRDPCTSEVTVRSDTGGEVTLTPASETEQLISGGSVTVTYAETDDSTFPYVAVFKDVPWGKYYVGDRVVLLNEADPQASITLTSATTSAP